MLVVVIATAVSRTVHGLRELFERVLAELALLPRYLLQRRRTVRGVLSLYTLEHQIGEGGRVAQLLAQVCGPIARRTASV